jgi:Peptidase_C39 like family
MTTVLHGIASGLPLDAVTRAIPPSCRGVVETAAPSVTRRDGDGTLIETPAWPAMGAAQFVPALSALTAAARGVRLELAVRAEGSWSPWVAGVELGSAGFAPLPPSDALDVDVDVFRARAPVEAVRLRARIDDRAAAAVLAAPWLLSLSAAAPPDPVAGGPDPASARLDVPALSQMDADAAIASRICSPTSVAMVLGYWRRAVPPATLAAEIFDPGTDLYGIWPAAILAAGRRGVMGYLLRFPDWASAAWCLGRGLPLIASIRYSAGELTGAAIAETSGHLVVLTGCDNGDVLVNDPAAPTPTVPRRYRIAEFARVWLERTGMGYVFFPPA